MSSKKTQKQTFSEKCFRDKNNNVVLAQKPNLPMVTAIVSYGLGVLIADGTIGKLLDVVGFGALFTFAWLELFQGVNYFRRALGAIVLIVTIYSRI